jgi:protein-S-isoprenylcysteine O-methyltransferase Ste14
MRDEMSVPPWAWFELYLFCVALGFLVGKSIMLVAVLQIRAMPGVVAVRQPRKTHPDNSQGGFGSNP